VHAQKKRIGVSRQIPQNVAASKALHFVKLSGAEETSCSKLARMYRHCCWETLERGEPVAFFCFFSLGF